MTLTAIFVKLCLHENEQILILWWAYFSGSMTELCSAPGLEQIPRGSLLGTGPDKRTRPAVWGMRVCTTAAQHGCGGREFFGTHAGVLGLQQTTVRFLIVQPLNSLCIHRIDWLVPFYCSNCSAKRDEVLEEHVSTDKSVKFNYAMDNVTGWVSVCLVADQWWEWLYCTNFHQNLTRGIRHRHLGDAFRSYLSQTERPFRKTSSRVTGFCLSALISVSPRNVFRFATILTLIQNRKTTETLCYLTFSTRIL